MTPYHISTLCLATILLIIAYIAAARWLQQRSAWLTPHAEVDAVYILPGAPSRGERMEAALDWAWQYDGQPATILIPEDSATGPQLNKAGELVPVAEWQKERLQEALSLLSSYPQLHPKLPINGR